MRYRAGPIPLLARVGVVGLCLCAGILGCAGNKHDGSCEDYTVEEWVYDYEYAFTHAVAICSEIDDPNGHAIEFATTMRRFYRQSGCDRLDENFDPCEARQCADDMEAAANTVRHPSTREEA